ncbi:MAG: hypothetical protein J0I08_23510 [Rhizobiales bacterium]|nr:hypothetical protein [Hyphomicrobiales bacterium]
MSLRELSDESILRYHANVRSMVALDIGVDGRTLLGEQARKRAKALEDELTRRGIEFEPIVWPE